MTLRAPIKEANNNSNRGCDWRFFQRRSLRLDNDDGMISDAHFSYLNHRLS